MADDSRAQRAEARERRRSLASKPFEEMDEAADQDRQSSPLAGAKGVAGKAAAAALTGALVGAAKAYADRRSREKKQQDEPDEDEATPDEPQREPDVTDEADPQEEQPEQQAEPEPESEPDEQPTDERDSPDDETNGERGRSSEDAAQIVRQAREHLTDLLGIEAESVSGLNHSNGAWHVMVEAVEVRRVPESQDVLASYEVVLDDDGGVVSVERTHRYRRAQVEAD